MGARDPIDNRLHHSKRMVESSCSYCLDERLQALFGHFLKDFEMGISPETLGPKFGQYGTFLPVTVRQNQSNNVGDRISQVPNGKAYWSSWKESVQCGLSQTDNNKQLGLTVLTDKIRKQDHQHPVAHNNQGSVWKRVNKLEMSTGKSQASVCGKRKELDLPEAAFKRPKNCSAEPLHCRGKSFFRFMQKAINPA